MRNAERGLSLIEILFGLAIMSIIFVMVADYYYSQNKRYLEVGKAATQIQQLASISYEWQTTQSQSDFQGISLTVLQNAGLLSKTDTYSQLDPWGGSISIAADQNDPHYVAITLPQIPEYACTNLRSRMANVAHTQSSAGECTQGAYYITL